MKGLYVGAMEKPKGKGGYRMDDAIKEIASEVKEEAKKSTCEVKGVTLEAAEVIALALTIGLAGVALGSILLVLAII